MKKMIKNFKPLAGKHCNTSSIQQIFHYFGHKLSEEMIFGLASGLHFVYFEFKFSPIPSENRWTTFDLKNIKEINPDMLKKAIQN